MRLIWTDQELGRVTSQVSAAGAIDKSLEDYRSNKIFSLLLLIILRRKSAIFS